MKISFAAYFVIRSKIVTFMKKLIKKIAQGPITFLQRKVENVFLHGQPPTLASFCLYFTYKSTTGFPTNYIVIKVMHLVSVTGSQTDNLSIMSPLDRGFRSKLCVVG